MIAYLLLEQIGGFFLMMACGYGLVRLGLLRQPDARALSVVCIYVIIPCSVLHSFQIPYTNAVRDGFLLAVAAAVLIHVLLFFMTWLAGRALGLDAVERASLIYSNAGNMVLPLVAAILGQEWVIYASAFICVQQFAMWTHGQSLMEGRIGFNWKKLLMNVNLLCVFAGAGLFFLRIRLPGALDVAVANLAACLGPVSMVMLGVTMASVSWKAVLERPRVYAVTGLKMLLFPGLIMAGLKYAPLASLVPEGKTILLITLLAVITPSAATVVQLAQLYDREPGYASALNVMTTLASIGTMPALVWLYQA